MILKNGKVIALTRKKSLSFLYWGMLCSAVAIILRRFASGDGAVDFIEGFFSGLCVTLIITGLIFLRKKD